MTDPVRLEVFVRSARPFVEVYRDGELELLGERADPLEGLLRVTQRILHRWHWDDDPSAPEPSLARPAPGPVTWAPVVDEDPTFLAERWIDEDGRSLVLVLSQPKRDEDAKWNVQTTIVTSRGPETHTSREWTPLRALLDGFRYLELLTDELGRRDNWRREVLEPPKAEVFRAWNEKLDGRLAEVGPLEGVPGSSVWRVYAAVDGVEFEIVERTPILAWFTVARHVAQLNSRVAPVWW